MGYFPAMQRGGAGGLSKFILNIDVEENKTKTMVYFCISMCFLLFYTPQPQIQVHILNFFKNWLILIKYHWMAGERSLSHELILKVNFPL